MTIETTEEIATGFINVNVVHFDFCERWSGMVRTAQFTQREGLEEEKKFKTYNVLIDDLAGTAPMPNEVKAGELFISAFGVDPDTGMRITSVPAKIIVKKSGFVGDGATPIPPTPDLYAQLIVEIQNEANAATQKINEAVYQYLIENPISLEDIGAAPANHSHTAEEVGAAPKDHTHTAEALGALPAGGTAANAAMLDNKPASYYLPVQNLLDNPDFAIAQAGYPEWDETNQKWVSGLHGSELYAADRWNASFSDSTFSRNGTVNHFESKTDGYAFISQRLFGDGREKGKAYTFAIVLADGTVKVANGTFPSTDVSTQTVVGSAHVKDGCALYMLKEASGHVRVRIDLTKAGASVDFLCVRLIPGTYTADNMPPVVPPKYAAELAECKFYYQGKRQVQTVGSYDGYGKNWYVTLPIEQEMRKPDNQNAPSVVISNIRWIGIDPAIATFYSQQPSYTYSYYSGDQRGVTIQIVFEEVPIASVNNCGHGYIFLTYELNSDL